MMDTKGYTFTGSEDGTVFINCKRCVDEWNKVYDKVFNSDAYRISSEAFPDCNEELAYDVTLSEIMQWATRHEAKYHRENS